MRPLTEIRRKPVAEVVGQLISESPQASTEAGRKLVAQAAEYGIGLREYLTLAIDPMAGETENDKFPGLNGYEASLAALNLPFKNDFEQGILLQAASETFQKYPGTRAMFPEVIDDMLRWQNRQNQWEKVEDLVANSRTISGTELVSTAVLDDSDVRDTYTVPELARIPVRTIRTTETTVKMFKHGSAYRTSYEFNRRASLDLLTPFANRVARELELSKLSAALNILINGDGVHSAAPVVKQVSLTKYDYDNANKGRLQYRPLVGWLLDRAQAGTPVDTLVGNYDAWFQYMTLFSPVLNVTSEIEAMAGKGLTPNFTSRMPFPGGGSVTFHCVGAMPEGKLLGFTRGETLEELIEAGAQISENDRSVLNQSITYVRSEVTGYKLAFGDTRSILDFKSES